MWQKVLVVKKHTIDLPFRAFTSFFSYFLHFIAFCSISTILSFFRYFEPFWAFSSILSISSCFELIWVFYESKWECRDHIRLNKINYIMLAHLLYSNFQSCHVRLAMQALDTYIHLINLHNEDTKYFEVLKTLRIHGPLWWDLVQSFLRVASHFDVWFLVQFWPQ